MLKIKLFVCIILTAQLAFAQKQGSLEETKETEDGFLAGTRIIFSDNFEKDALGDFPAKWNSTKAGEVKKLKGFENKFLKISDGAVVSPQLTKDLPEHFTIEYDLIVPDDVPIRMASVGFGIKPFPISYMLSLKDGVVFSFHSFANGINEGLKFGTKNANTSQPGLQKVDYKIALNKVTKVAIAVNNTRIRFYADGVKLVDMPTAFNPLFRKAFFFCPSIHGAKESKLNYFYISNLVIAEAGTDRRSQIVKDLMEKGSVSTNAITFASNSDKLTPESSDVIQQFVDAMKESTALKLKIIGHTDSDGEDAANLLLSKKRASAVKVKMVSLGIEPGRLLTDGKGEKEPVEDNKTEEGKLQNRRVEFVKQ
ncbi:OmpA family protein [Dyadobacter sp. 3J3]|uniref:OmpA family protein n=1 Tax=Dyadobacter sp. 3J3 TaxID=2606600 RepID=UPI001359EAA2|nr:OmpA family protein [Dyadobacter sp. 3J3]